VLYFIYKSKNEEMAKIDIEMMRMIIKFKKVALIRQA
jgi:septin family protein